jgi:hypothetical protein
MTQLVSWTVTRIVYYIHHQGWDNGRIEKIGVDTRSEF